MALRPIKTNFTNGELDPLIEMRSDLQLFQNGASLMRNVFAFPQGGFRRRDGLPHMTLIPPPGQSAVLAITGGEIDASGTGYVPGELLTLIGGTFNEAAVYKVIDVPNAIQVLSGDLNVGGAGYSVGDKIFPTDGTFSEAAEFEVLTEAAGVITSIQLNSGGVYTVASGANSGTTTDGGGAGATLQNIVSSSLTGTTKVELITSGDYSVLPTEPAMTSSNLSGTGATINNITSETQDVVQLIDFSFSIDQNYLMVFTVSRFYIFRQEDTGSGPMQLVFTGIHVYTNQQLLELTWTQSLDVMLIFHKDVSIRQITRLLENDWTFEEFALINIPSFAFGVLQTTRIDPKTGNNPSVGDEKQITSPDPTFSLDDVGKKIRIIGATDLDGKNFSSYYEITEFVTSQDIKAKILVAPITDSNFTVNAEEWLLEEDQWSVTRGFPRCGTFFQGRLCLAGTIDRPNTFWASRAGDITDFNNGGSADDLGIQVTSDTGSVVTIFNIYPGRNLQFFGDSGEFYIPIFENIPITPTNTVLRRTTSVGSTGGIPVFEIDGVVYFIHRGGESMNEFVFTNQEKAYSANTVSLQSSHLIRNPRDAAAKKSINTEDGNYIWVVNDEDGSMAAFSVLRSDDINAWSLLTTEGVFKQTAVLDQTSYFHIQREIDGETIDSIEYFDRDLRFDNGVIAKNLVAPVSSVSGLDYLEGETVGLIIDDILQEDQTVTGGVLTFPVDAENSYQFGMHFPLTQDENGDTTEYQTLVKTLPADLLINSNSQSTMGKQKRIPAVTVRARDSQGFYVQDIQVPFREMPDNILDAPIPLQSGNYELQGLLGWDEFGQITIGQKEPLAMTVLGLAYDLSTS